MLILKNIFKSDISIPQFIQRGDNEYKTSQFYCISKIYPENNGNSIKILYDSIKEEEDFSNLNIKKKT